MPKRRGYTHYQSKRRYADEYQSRNYGEVELNFGDLPMYGTGASAVATGEMAGSGTGTFFRIASADEVDTVFRVPADFDAAATSYVHFYYAIASSTIATNDTITPLVTYQVPVPGTNASGLADADVVTGVGNPTAITLGTAVAVGSMYEAEASLSSAATISAGGMCHVQVTTKTTCATDVECRLLTRAVFRYAKEYL